MTRKGSCSLTRARAFSISSADGPMNQPAALRPLDEAADDIRRLVDPPTPDELAAATVAVAAAIEESLRLRLQDWDPHLSFDAVVKSLRTKNLISLETAGTVHEAHEAGDRAAAGSMRPGDADRVRAAVDRLRSEFGSAGAAPDTPGDDAESSGSTPKKRSAVTDSYSSRWMRWVAAAIAAVLLLGAVWMGIRSQGEEYEDALMAFRAGRVDSAAAGFERVLDDRPRDVTVMLYLARSYRRLERPEEAADVLRRALDIDPDDGDVRRELGHLFMDLDRPASAIAQYERAVEHDPEEPLNWAALIRALQRAGDPRAEQLLRDAPAAVRATLGGA